MGGHWRHRGRDRSRRCDCKLGYLANQIHQNTEHLEQSTRSARAEAVSASNVALRDTRRSIFESDEMTDIFLRGNNVPGSLSDVHQLRYRLVMQNVTEAVVDIHAQTAVTRFSPETWQSTDVSLALRVLGTPGGRWFWSEYADNYPTEFRREVEGILAANSAA